MLLHNTLHTRDIPTRTPHHFGDVGIAAAFTNQNRNISKVGHLAVLLQNRSDTAPPSCDAAEIQPAPKQYQLHGKPVPTTQTPRTNYTKTAPNQSTSVPFWATKFERFPLREVGESKRFVNADGTPADAVLVRKQSDGAMLLDESGDGIPADIEVVITYKDEHCTKFTDRVSLNPDLWVSTTFRSTERHSTSVTYGGEN